MNMRLIEMCLLIIATVVGIANYKGLSQLLQDDWSHKVYAVIIAIAVAAMTFAFWHGAFKTAPLLERFVDRLRAWVITFLACLFLIAFSAYWSVISLGGQEAVRYGYANVVATGEKALAEAEASGSDQEGPRTSLVGLEGDVRATATCEVNRGCLTGSAGPLGVGSTLHIVADTVKAQITALDAAVAARRAVHAEGKACLEKTRSAVAPSTPADERGPRLAAGIDCLNASIAALRGGGVRQSIAQALRSLTEIALPVTIKTQRQKQAATNALASYKTKADAIAARLEQAGPGKAFEPVPMPPASAAIAVIANWQAIIPAWATALALDLAPLLLLAYAAAITASRRGTPEGDLLTITVGDLLSAQQASDRLEGRTAPRTIALHRIGAGNTFGPREDGTVMDRGR
ncbi:hypothetical protein [Bosea caraganae]|nr:hypothetical protein [Bosea caraganae]